MKCSIQEKDKPTLELEFFFVFYLKMTKPKKVSQLFFCLLIEKKDFEFFYVSCASNTLFHEFVSDINLIQLL